MGERKMLCHTASFADGTAIPGQTTNADYAYLCIDVDATDQEKEDDCLDACVEWLDGLPGFYCGFYDEEEPYPWDYCTEPEDEPTAGAAAPACPSWYAPGSKVSGYSEPSPGVATVTVEESFLLDIRAELSSLYTCDTSRYVESSSNWTFEDVEAGDLLYALGVRDGDQNATVQGFRAGTTSTTTSVYPIDSVDSGYEAYVALYDAEGVKLTVERSGAPGGELVIWITIDP